MRTRESSGKKAESKSKSITLVPARLDLFGPPQLLDGEDAAAYEKLRAHIYEAAKPADAIEEMFIADVVALQWEVLRWRRLKVGLIQARAVRALKEFLGENLDYDLYRQQFADQLSEALEEASEVEAQTLAHNCVMLQESDAVAKVRGILERIDRDFDIFEEDVRVEKVEELIEKFSRGESDARRIICECLAGDGNTIDSLVAEALTEKFEYIERIDRLTTIAENRRNTALREIDRRRVVLGETLRQTVQEIEYAKYERIEAKPAKGKNAA